jgi:hypothetical protein
MGTCCTNISMLYSALYIIVTSFSPDLLAIVLHRNNGSRSSVIADIRSNVLILSLFLNGCDICRFTF